MPGFRLSVPEFVGSLADLGTLLPLMTGLIVLNGIRPETAIRQIGITYILTGLYYRLPVPVQPLKAVAMIAIATGASTGEIRAAALWMAGLLLVLAATGLVDKLDRVFPRLLISGLQFGLGLMMIRSGMKFVLSYPHALGSLMPGTHASGRFEAAGIFPQWAQFQVAFFCLLLPQIPLTLGNSVIATRDCALKYFGSAGSRVTAGRLAATIGLGNLAAGLVGGVPVCHGAGGMTAHYRFGARTGAAGVMIGSLFLLLGVLGSHRIPSLLSGLPAWALGLPLAYVGVWHAMLAKGSFRRPATAVVVLSMGAVSYLNANLLAALGIGLAVKLLLLDVPRLVRARIGPMRQP